MYEVYDINFDEVIERVRTLRKAMEICRDLNGGKRDVMYAIRETRK